MAQIISNPVPVSPGEQAEIEGMNNLISRLIGALPGETLVHVFTNNDPCAGGSVDSLDIYVLLRMAIERGAITRDDIMAMDAQTLLDAFVNARADILVDAADESGDAEAFWAGLPEITYEVCERAIANLRAYR